ncbi:TcmI family type II polyketide cyclase [Saccharothrix sp. S26]|uniref:TcmI family type II polyketide cyclase n=1 Tax=Saccharothrix sp. S26 TaxID=2907215 RepID=UPI001F1AEE0B|nr:TcmI family type II polyketide cyclase [Saccharothrix sp. S26]MCE6997196.1 TcmI family type II polyketide cyclase [Saccharothrix sp. S26]
MHRTLIVARMVPGAAARIADVFRHSDQDTDLPGLIGVRGRSLFQFGELYLHLVEGAQPVEQAVSAHRHHPEFRRISDELRPHVRAYDPDTWREPRDAMAREFYRWEARP